MATGNEAIKFDLKKFIWVGQAFDDAQVVYLKTSTPYTSFEAIRKANKEGKQPNMGAQVARSHQQRRGEDRRSRFSVSIFT